MSAPAGAKLPLKLEEMLNIGTISRYKGNVSRFAKLLILLLVMLWTDNPFLGTIPLLNPWFEREQARSEAWHCALPKRLVQCPLRCLSLETSQQRFDWLRKGVPEDLRALVGKREEKRSLLTRESVEARRLHAEALAELEAR